jgi:hypothetical protein
MAATKSHPMSGVDSLTPAEIARLVEDRGVAKADASILTTFVLGVLAGAFIALGAVLSTVVATGSTLGYGPTRLLSGLAFSLGLILVVIAGAELFTGNNLITMSWVSRHISLSALLRNWGIVYIGNLVGALSIVVMLSFADWWEQADESLGGTALSIAIAKASLPISVVFFRGILANALVCLAVWLATAGRDRQDPGDRVPDQRLRRGRVRAQRRQHVLLAHGAGAEGRGVGHARGGNVRPRTGGPRHRCHVRERCDRDVGERARWGRARRLVYWFVYLRSRKHA